MVYSSYHMVCSIIGGTLLCFMSATSLSWSTPIVPKLMNSTTTPFGTSIGIEEASWISSFLSIGSIIGMVLFGYYLNTIGRKYTLVLGGIPFFLSHLIIAFTTSVNFYYLARFLMGVTVGSMLYLPMYICELTHKSQRSVIATLMCCASVGGILFSNSLGPFVTIRTFSLTLVTISLISLVFFTLLGHEVPQYYMTRNKEPEARAALEKLRGGYEDIDEAFSEIKDKYLEDKKGTLRNICTSKGLRKGLIMCSCLHISQQSSGIVAILNYGQMFFENADFGLSPEISVIILGFVQFVSSFLAPPLTLRYGKIFLLCLSGIGMILTEIVLAIYSYLDSVLVLPKYLDYVPIVCLTIFIIAYGIGFGPLPWVILGEAFPIRVKAVATSIVGCLISITSFLMTKYFMQMVDAMGLHGYFIFSSVCCLSATLFVKFYVIETKDKSLEEIQFELSR